MSLWSRCVYAIAVTNRPDLTDPMVGPGRLEKRLYVDLPSGGELDYTHTFSQGTSRYFRGSIGVLAALVREVAVVALKGTLGALNDNAEMSESSK